MTAIAILIVVSDPWNVGEALGWKPIQGQLLGTRTVNGAGRALIKFNDPVSYRKQSYCYAVASPRLEGRDISEIREGKVLGCAITGISDEQAVSCNPMDISKWRGGFAFVGDIQRS
jgi:hypothetical protein